ncbi:acetyl-hydrolase [Pyrenophora tritici-repentis]|nr:Acetyl-hydrolase [Pyrenophora tritici-repentis]KAI1530701.1 acetyl-hydrolase [Pyrenophora tritici-repentis]KAI1547406.1 acetyl-hydrolase [Pyrenophora tritici-repentis]KAI1565537.1 acetyl-hydrolase [Pyrenophora tritici-repentis]KAI1570503.1 acetyl-hydrolase [Pyrenophora tritici-repentis]
MPVNTISVGAAVTPVVIQTWLSHYLNRRPLAQKPTAHISYHEGLELIRRFLNYASFHTVDELQAFTSQWVPVPRWVHVEVVEISSSLLQRSAQHITAQLGPEGVKAVGGTNWWQWRREESTLKAEWIEMRKDFEARKQLAIHKGDRIMLYVHGGAYFFGSVDEHRYQMQRHARKLKARVLAPKYRLAPQFPFPCGLQDCLAAYLYLLEQKHDPATIILAGDSAGGGMVLSILVTMRDQGIPLPAGAILISPWVDLTHSFPSLGGDDKMDYIPSHGFIHKPSMSWRELHFANF